MSLASDVGCAPGLNWLVSYPKSGNTWLRLLLNAYLNPGRPLDINRLQHGTHAASHHLHEPVLGCFASDLTPDEAVTARRTVYRHLARTPHRPMFLKVHDANPVRPDDGPVCPPEATHAVVLMVRHPFDVAVSLAYHWGMAPHFEDAIDAMADPRRTLSRIAGQFPQTLGTWSTHTESWLDLPVPRLVVRYEDVHDDPVRILEQVVRTCFPSRPIVAEHLARAVEACTFARLREQEETATFVERPPGAERFFRAGRTGGYVEHLTPRQCRRLATEHAQVMSRLGYGPDGDVCDPPSGGPTTAGTDGGRHER